MNSFISLVQLFVFSATLTTKADELIKPPTCDYTAIYNFGDSNSDTGGIYAAFYPPALPYGETYFGRPVGRASDGRLIIDFIADHLGLPFLSAYLDSLGSSYQHGANFATGGATILRPNGTWFDTGASPFNLEIQAEHYTQLKDGTAFYYKQSNDECLKQRLPISEDFSKALFTLDIGQNDLAAGIRSLTYKQQQAAVTKVVNEFVSQVSVLNQRGAKTFWIHNTGPIGCLPTSTAKVKDPPPGYLDHIGCIKYQNEIALEFNKELKNAIVKLRTELSDAIIVYVDMYSAKYELISTAKKQGFDDPFMICCGYHGTDYNVYCGNKGNVNGTEVFAGSCKDPSKVISWDGVHYTDTANKWIANLIVNGSLSDPPVAITRACLEQ